MLRAVLKLSVSGLVLGLGLTAGSPLHAESSVKLMAPRMLEAIGATTFDDKGRAVGQSSFEMETTENGVRRMHVTLAIEGGGSNVSQATLAPIESASIGIAGRSEDSTTGDIALRLIEERSQATTADGVSFPLLVIDHLGGRVSCYPADEEEEEAAGQHVDIPEDDRVVNVPMQLLFMPLVRGETDTLKFQIATCAPGPVLHQMIAVRGKQIVREGRDIIEIEYGPDFGKTVAFLASRLLPSFSFWFDAKDGDYLGHRMPLHRKGPEVLLVRSGLEPPDIGVD